MSERRKILIAYDGSNFADDAIDELPRAGLPEKVDALIVYVREKWLPPPSSYEVVEESFALTASAGAKAARVNVEPEVLLVEVEVPLLEKAYKKLRALFPEWNIEKIDLSGSPTKQIMQKALEWNADLVVVGSHGQTGNTLFSLGSVSQKLANEANCSVRVVRGDALRKNVPNRIVVGLDGTSAAEAAVAEVARRDWVKGTEVRLVVVKDVSETAETNKTDAWIRGFLENAKNILRPTGLIVREMIEAGDPKRILVAEAGEWDADCIFIGCNDTGKFLKNLLLGSVATAVVSRAHCSVEIVREK